MHKLLNVYRVEPVGPYTEAAVENCDPRDPRTARILFATSETFQPGNVLKGHFFKVWLDGNGQGDERVFIVDLNALDQITESLAWAYKGRAFDVRSETGEPDGWSDIDYHSDQYVFRVIPG